MRFATYNVEWFTNLFDNHDRLVPDDRWSGRQDIKRRQQIEALGIVFTAIDADAVMVVEAPDTNGRRSTVAALEDFAATFDLRARKAVMGFATDTQQELALLYDPDKLTARHDPLGDATGKKGSSVAPRFDSVFRIDLNHDGQEDLIEFSKPPMELALTTAGGRALRLIGVHVKSKAPHGARGKEAIMRLSIENRRKQLAQCVWLRTRVDDHLAAGDSLIVLGDFNDGPGLDEYERLFGRSGVEIVLGDDGCPCLYDPHASMALGQRIGAMPTTARFYLPHQKRFLSALLDYIMVSDDLHNAGAEWRIWHPFDDSACYGTPELREALLTASDHFPVTLDIAV